MSTSTPTDPYLLEETIDVDAPPAAVWSVVSDLRRMGEWSPQTRRMFVRGGPVGVGTRTINVNRHGWRVWPTTSKVVRFAPEKELAFRIPENGTTWSYELTDLGDGRTRVVERREAPRGTTPISKWLIKTFLGGDADFREVLTAGMRTTLVRLRAEAERG